MKTNAMKEDKYNLGRKEKRRKFILSKMLLRKIKRLRGK